METLGRGSSTVVNANKNGLYRGNVEKPKKGWTAYFLELTYDVGAPAPLKLTTNVAVVPKDVASFENKRSDLATSVTLVAVHKPLAAKQAADDVRTLAKGQGFAKDGVTAQVRGGSDAISTDLRDVVQTGRKS